jgi:choline kinase
VYHPDHVSALVNSAADIAITADRRWLNLWSLRSENPISDAETFREEGGVLKEIGGRPESLKGISGQYMGLLSFTPSGWQKFHTIYRNLDPVRQKSLDMTSWLMLAINKKYLINVTYVEGRWCEVDCQADLQIYQEQLFAADKLKGSWEHDWRWT